MLFDPGIFHRDSFAKYAAAFFTISKSSFVLANSRRNRTFSASTSVSDRFTGTATASDALNLPARFSCTQFHKLECGIPNRLAASVIPSDSLNRTAFDLELIRVLSIPYQLSPAHLVLRSSANVNSYLMY